jgi:hypothetical protein
MARYRLEGLLPKALLGRARTPLRAVLGRNLLNYEQFTYILRRAEDWGP